MAVVHIPAHLRAFTDGRDRVMVSGSTLGQVLEALTADWPRLGEQLMEHGKVRPEIVVAIDGVVTESLLFEAVGEDSEIHLIPAIGGGSS